MNVFHDNVKMLWLIKCVNCGILLTTEIGTTKEALSAQDPEYHRITRDTDIQNKLIIN